MNGMFWIIQDQSTEVHHHASNLDGEVRPQYCPEIGVHTATEDAHWAGLQKWYENIFNSTSELQYSLTS